MLAQVNISNYLIIGSVIEPQLSEIFECESLKLAKKIYIVTHIFAFSFLFLFPWPSGTILITNHLPKTRTTEPSLTNQQTHYKLSQSDCKPSDCHLMVSHPSTNNPCLASERKSQMRWGGMGIDQVMSIPKVCVVFIWVTEHGGHPRSSILN